MQPSQDRILRTVGAAASVLASSAVAQGAPAQEQLAAGIEAALTALVGERAFADLPGALREAELQALQITLSIYQAGLSKKDGATSDAGSVFHDAAVRFSATELAAGKAAAGGMRLIRQSDGAAARRTIAQRRLAAEEGLLTEIDLALGPNRIPERFLALYLDARPDGAAWFDAFSLYVAWHVRSDKGLQAGLERSSIPALSELGLSLDALLESAFQQAKQTALRLEDRLAAAEAGADGTVEIENREVEGYLARLSAEAGQRHGLLPPTVSRIVANLRQAGVPLDSFEQIVGEQARRAKAVLDRLAAAKGSLVEDKAAELIGAGQLAEAYDSLSKLPETADNELIKAHAAALKASWGVARTHFNRAIGLIAPQQRQQALEAAHQLARVLLREKHASAHLMAIDLYEAVVGAAPKELEAARLAELQIEMVAAVLRCRRSERQLSLLTSAIAAIGKWEPEQLRQIGLVLKARLAEARGDALLGLTAHGADRTGEAKAAYAEALQAVSANTDARLVSQLHVKISDLLAQQARKSTGQDAVRLKEEARRELYAAQVLRLRARDPIWWAEVKVRTAEFALRAAPSDAAALRAGLISAKAGLRLIPPALLPAQFAKALDVVGGTCLALDQAEPAGRWAGHALAAYEEALAAISPEAAPSVWSDLQVKIATVLTRPGAGPDEIDRAIAHYRAALGALAPKAPRLAHVQGLLAAALAASGRQRMDLARLDEAAGLFRTVLEALPVSYHWVQAWTGLAETVAETARLRHDASMIDMLIPRLQAAEKQAAAAGSAPWLAKALAKVVAETKRAQKKIASAQLKAGVSAPARKVAMLLRQG